MYVCVLSESVCQGGVFGLGHRQSRWGVGRRVVCAVTLTKGELADDVALLASTKEAAKIAVREYKDVTTAFGLSVSLQKTEVHGCGPGMVFQRTISQHWCWAMAR